MKKVIFLGGFTGLMILSACGDPAPASVSETIVQRTPVVLTEDDLFQGNMVMAYLENEEKFTQVSNELFLKGLNSYRNENDLDSADTYLRQSILKEPSAKAYFELGNIYFDKQQYDDALVAYGLAEQLDYEPFSKILYNKACLYSLQEESELAGKYLEYALQAGYNNLDHIEKDPDLKELRESYFYDVAIKRGLRGMSNAENLFWLQFKKQFAVMSLPLKLRSQIEEENLHTLQFISYDYEKYISEMRDESFSREVSKGFYYYSRPFETENFVAIIYIVKDEFMGVYAPLTYRMATFTHEGKLIDKKEIAGRQGFSDPIWMATVNKDLSIDIDLMRPTYEKDPDEYGYFENPMVSSKVIGTLKMRVNKVGNIVQEGDAMEGALSNN